MSEDEDLVVDERCDYCGESCSPSAAPGDPMELMRWKRPSGPCAHRKCVEAAGSREPPTEAAQTAQIEESIRRQRAAEAERAGLAYARQKAREAALRAKPPYPGGEQQRRFYNLALWRHQDRLHLVREGLSRLPSVASRTAAKMAKDRDALRRAFVMAPERAMKSASMFRERLVEHLGVLGRAGL